MTASNSQQRLGHYRNANGRPFYVAEIVPSDGDGEERGVLACANGIASVLDRSWQTKFVPGVFSEADLAAKLPTGRQVERNINEGRNHYLVAVDGLQPVTDPEQVIAFTAYEDYRPRRPTRANPFLAKYPNIRDLESSDGQQAYESAVPRLALLHHVVRPANPNHKVSAYAEESSPMSVSFYEFYGFKRDDSIPPAQLTETIGESQMTYVHMEATAAGPIQRMTQLALSQYVESV